MKGAREKKRREKLTAALPPSDYIWLTVRRPRKLHVRNEFVKLCRGNRNHATAAWARRPPEGLEVQW